MIPLFKKNMFLVHPSWVVSDIVFFFFFKRINVKFTLLFSLVFVPLHYIIILLVMIKKKKEIKEVYPQI